MMMLKLTEVSYDLLGTDLPKEKSGPSCGGMNKSPMQKGLCSPSRSFTRSSKKPRMLDTLFFVVVEGTEGSKVLVNVESFDASSFIIAGE